jgi:hypothetical protein
MNELSDSALSNQWADLTLEPPRRKVTNVTQAMIDFASCVKKTLFIPRRKGACHSQGVQLTCIC